MNLFPNKLRLDFEFAQTDGDCYLRKVVESNDSSFAKPQGRKPALELLRTGTLRARFSKMTILGTKA